MDPRTVSPEEKERTIKLARQIFSNFLRQHFSPDEVRELSRQIAALKQPPAPAPQREREPEPPRELLAETIGSKPEQPKIEVAESKVDTAGYFDECLHKFRR